MFFSCVVVHLASLYATIGENDESGVVAMSPKLKNCSNCGRIFVDTGLGICRDCHEKEEEQMQEVSSYVRDHPRSRVKEIAEALGVKERLIMRMIREGRFVVDGVALEYPCETCGTFITKGRFCDKCNKDLQDQISQQQQRNAAQAAKEKASGPKAIRSLDMGMKGFR